MTHKKTMIENKECIDKIISELKKNNEGLTISQLERKIKLPRDCIRISIAYLEGCNKIKIRNIGSSKLIILI